MEYVIDRLPGTQDGIHEGMMDHCICYKLFIFRVASNFLD